MGVGGGISDLFYEDSIILIPKPNRNSTRKGNYRLIDQDSFATDRLEKVKRKFFRFEFRKTKEYYLQPAK